MNHETLTPIRIFLASPEDCADDREKVKAVIQELNGTVARAKGLVLEPYTWKDVVGGMGRPEQVILDQIQMGEIDIFVGLMWRRFGTPTGKAYDSGTEEEFFQAYTTWCSKGQPRILFYFCKRKFYPSKHEIEQLKRVMELRNSIGKRGIFKEYKTSNELTSMFRRDLTRLLNDWGKPPKARGLKKETIQGEGWEIWRDAFETERNSSQRVEAYLYKQADLEVKFMTISGRSIYSTDVEDAIRSRNPDKFQFKLLLFNWDSPHFAEKMRDERRRTDNEIRQAKDKAKLVARQFLTLGEDTGMDLQVRLYQEYPVWRFMVLDEMIAYVGYYPPNKRGYEGPMFSFCKTDLLGLFYPINQYFDKLWEVSSPLVLEDLK